MKRKKPKNAANPDEPADPSEILQAENNRYGHQWQIARAIYGEWEKQEAKGNERSWAMRLKHLPNLFGRGDSKPESIQHQASRYLRAWKMFVVDHKFDLKELQRFSPAYLGDIAWTEAVRDRAHAREILDRISSGHAPSRDNLLRELRQNSPKLKSRSRANSPAWLESRKRLKKG